MLMTKTVAPAAPAGLVEVICAAGVLAELPGAGMCHLELGQKVKLAAPVASQVVASGRGYYVNRSDDPMRDKRFSLTAERLAAIENQAAALTARAAERAEAEAYARATRRELIARYGA